MRWLRRRRAPVDDSWARERSEDLAFARGQWQAYTGRFEARGHGLRAPVGERTLRPSERRP